MNPASKTSSLQAYHLILYRKALHPEFFGIEDRRQISYSEYDFESWIFRGGHTLLFQHQGLCITEIISDRLDGMPERGLVTALPCAGEKDHEEEFANRVNYVSSVQTETLSQHLYLATYRELHEHAEEGDGLMTMWDDANGHNLSLVDIQRYRDEIHVQGYHLRSDCCLVLRTQTIFSALGVPSET